MQSLDTGEATPGSESHRRLLSSLIRIVAAALVYLVAAPFAVGWVDRHIIIGAITGHRPDPGTRVLQQITKPARWLAVRWRLYNSFHTSIASRVAGTVPRAWSPPGGPP